MYCYLFRISSTAAHTMCPPPSLPGSFKNVFLFFALVPFYFVCVREMWTGEKWARSDKRVDSAGRGVKSLSLAPRTHIQQRERERL
jgi:hypothetical protein